MSTSATSDWTKISLDLLGEIASRLTLRDCGLFRRVCTSWASVNFPFMPYLLVPGDDGEYQSLLRATDNKSFPVADLPALRGKWCVGCQGSWVATLNKSEVSLLNHITGEEIALPSISILGEIGNPTFTGIRPAFWVVGFTPGKRRCLVPQIAFSPNPSTANYTAVALLDYPATFVYTRAGDDKWIAAEELDRAQDVIYRDGRFLAVFQSGQTVAVDLSVNKRPSELVAGRLANESSSVKYLVDSAGDLLQVQRYFRQTRVRQGRMIAKTRSIQVFRWDAKQDVWAPVESLGDRSLFVGECSSFVLSAREVPGLKGNRVYFTDDYRVFIYSDKWGEATCDAGVFSLEDGSIEPCFPPIRTPERDWRVPVWITLPKALPDVGVDRWLLKF